MTFKDIYAFNKYCQEHEDEFGDQPDGWIDVHEDGSISFYLADTSTPYGC